MIQLPRVSYGLSRNFRWKWFSLIAYTGVLVVVGFLIPLNYALTGFETVSIMSPNFTMAASHWYRNFGSNPPGSDCEPRVFNIGDTFVTDSGIFTWSIAGVLSGPTFNNTRENVTSLASVIYNGTNLDNCDWIDMSVNANSYTMQTTFTASVVCNSTYFPVIMSTTVTTLDVQPPGTLLDDLAPESHSVANQISGLLNFAGVSLTENIATVLGTSNTTDPPATVVYRYVIKDGDGLFCHSQRVGPVFPSCLAVPPSFDSIAEYHIDAKSTYGLVDDTSSPYGATLNNSLQLMMAAVRLDIGNVLPNNFLVYNNTINATISQTPDVEVESNLYEHLIGGSGGNTTLGVPIDPSQPAIVATQYLCHVQLKKSTGQIIIAVLVATLSMFSSGWAAFIMVATYFEKKRYGEPDLRDGHFDVEGNPRENEAGGIPLMRSRPKREDSADSAKF
ncbi:hypothetical protein FRB94_014082 [Tulasnella sp. JGI-2019a]|nr:hypothetical protein FRB93_013101 [Tulasnella sp. JGI-2019a]KAG9007660.1 hypothetical protein FRB94_014082 [Tulasnella sp. JGI-2019a]